MGLWDDFVDVVEDVGEAIVDGAEAVAGAVEDTVNAVEEVVSDAVETVGNGISDFFSWLADAAKGIPVLREVLKWIGDVVSGVFQFIAGLIKGVLGFLGGLIAGVIRVVGGLIGGLLAWDASLLVKGLGDILAGFTGAVIIIAGKFVELIQSIIPLQWGKRRLTDKEEDMLERVFRGSVALYNVRIIEGFAGLFSVNDRPFTLGNTIYLKDRDPGAEPQLLVHETVHVWQYQNLGSRYVADALGAQAFAPGDAYDWQAAIARGDTRWQDFNAESQGEFFEEVYRDGKFITAPSPTGNGEFFDEEPVSASVEFRKDGTDHTTLARDAAAYVRDFFAWRLSGLL